MPDAPGRSRSLRDSRWGNLAILLVTAIVVMAVAYLSNRPSVSEVDVDTTAAAPLAGDIPPAFTAVDVDGETVSLADYEGEPVWLLFAATWCTSCRSEAPDVQAAYEATGIPVLTVYLGEDTPAITSYADMAGLTFTHIPDPNNEIAAAYGVMGIPAHIFIGADGVVRETAVGSLSPGRIDQILSALVG